MYQHGALPRRAFLGLQVDNELRVLRVLEQSAAASAGVMVGDRIAAVDEREMRSPRALADHARSISAGARVTFRCQRESLRSLVGEAPPYPVEAGVLLGHVTSHGARLRTFFALPETQPSAAVLYLQGVRADSCEAPLDTGHPTRVLVDAFTRAGFVVMRVERTGVGDSEGPSPRTTGLEVELDAYRAALAELLSFDEVDPNRVFLFGHSFGGMTAPLIAREAAVSGVCASGTSARRWYDCMLGTTQRQPGRELDARWTKLFELVIRQRHTPARVFEQHPELRALRSRDCEGETMHGRHISLFQELEAIDLASAWRATAVEARVLAMHGEHDWICTADESREIAALTNGQFLDVLGSGHEVDARLAAEAVDWMRKSAPSS